MVNKNISNIEDVRVFVYFYCFPEYARILAVDLCSDFGSVKVDAVFGCS
jgi:hypothetical protein